MPQGNHIRIARFNRQDWDELEVH